MIGDNVRRQRVARRMTQAALARAIGHKREVYVGRLERGYVKRPGVELLRRISEVLGCSIDDLVKSAPTNPSHR